MSIATSVSSVQSSPSPASWPLHRFTVAEYQRFVEIGAFGEDDPIELLEGWVVEKMPRNPPHDSTISRTERELRIRLPASWHARIQSSVVTIDSVPEPDLAVVCGSAHDYDEQHPTGADTVLVVEVAESCLLIDPEKKRLYARAGIEQYWIVNLVDRQLEAYSQAIPHEGTYAQRVVLSSADEAEFRLPSGETIRLSVSQLLPKPVV